MNSTHNHSISNIELGKVYFWTATINNWHPLLADEDFKKVIIDSLSFLSKKELIEIFGLVIMPNHIHLIWKVNGTNGKEKPSASFLKYTAHEFKKLLNVSELRRYAVMASNKKYEFWQQNPMAIELYSPSVIYQKLDYIHNNPVSGKWELATEPTNYQFSSAKYYSGQKHDFGFLKHISEIL